MSAKKPARSKPAPLNAELVGPPPGTLARLWEWFPLSPIKTRAEYERAATVAARMAVNRMNAVQRSYHGELMSLVEAFEDERGEADKTLARLKAIAKTIPDPHAIDETARKEAPPIRYPEHPGTPLRSQQFPTIEQAAQLAATLAHGKPIRNDEAAAELAASALRLWRVSRDQINNEQTLADEYWQKMDSNESGKVEVQERTKARLAALGAADWLDLETVPWDDAAALLWKDAPPDERDSQLAGIAAAMAGKSCWRLWTVDDFRQSGFINPFGFEALIYAFDAHEQQREQEAVSLKMSERGKASAAAKAVQKAEKEKTEREEAAKRAKRAGRDPSGY